MKINFVIRYSFLVLSFLFLPKLALAKDFSLSLSPAIIQFDTAVSNKLESNITIKNLTSGYQDLKIVFKIVKPATGLSADVEFIQDEETTNLQKDILAGAKIINPQDQLPIEEFALSAYESKDLVLQIDLQGKEIISDLYFSTIFLSDSQEESKTSFSQINPGIGNLVLVSPQTKKESNVQVLEFKTQDFIKQGPVEFSLAIKNTGKNLIEPSGKISIRNMFGMMMGEITIPRQIILAKAAKYLHGPEDEQPAITAANNQKTDKPIILWPEKFLFGRYTASLALNFPEANKSIVHTLSFIALPVMPISIITLLILFFLGIYLRVKNRL